MFSVIGAQRPNEALGGGQYRDAVASGRTVVISSPGGIVSSRLTRRYRVTVLTLSNCERVWRI